MHRVPVSVSTALYFYDIVLMDIHNILCMYVCIEHVYTYSIVL